MHIIAVLMVVLVYSLPSGTAFAHPNETNDTMVQKIIRLIIVYVLVFSSTRPTYLQAAWYTLASRITYVVPSIDKHKWAIILPGG